jgi:hypothetical protein
VLYADGVLGLALLVLWVYCLFDVITADPAAVRNLPKVLWFPVVLLLGALGIGPALWLYAGRPRTGLRAPLRKRAPRPGPGEGRNPDDDAEFLASLKARAEQQREQARRDRGDDGPNPG